METITVDDETAQHARLARLGALLEKHRSVVIAALEEAAEDHIDRVEAYCYDCGEGPGGPVGVRHLGRISRVHSIIVRGRPSSPERTTHPALAVFEYAPLAKPR